jgi:hypothetical protein
MFRVTYKNKEEHKKISSGTQIDQNGNKKTTV